MALPGRRQGITGLFQDLCDVVRMNNKPSSTSESRQDSNLTSHDRKVLENEKNQRKYEDGLKKGYIDREEYERIDKEYKDKYDI